MSHKLLVTFPDAMVERMKIMADKAGYTSVSDLVREAVRYKMSDLENHYGHIETDKSNRLSFGTGKRFITDDPRSYNNQRTPTLRD